MSAERSGSRYSGPKLFPDSREVIYDTHIAKLSDREQKVYLKGGYHSLVGRILNGSAFAKTLTPEQGAFLRNRLVRELIDCTALAHKDKGAADSLVEYFDEIANPYLSSQLSQGARYLAVTFIYGEARVPDLIE